MAHLAYADLGRAEVRALVRRVVEQRGKLLHLYAMLLHAPPVADGWLTYLTAIRQRTTIPAALRELAIMRIAALNGAAYEADEHRPIALRAGLSEEQLASLDTGSDFDLFGPDQKLVLALTDAMTRSIQVPKGCLTALETRFGPRGTVELIATVAAYNMVSRFLVALGIERMDVLPGPDQVV